MKRFGDVLRILSSVLVGSVIKDFDHLRDNLSALFKSWWIAELVSILLVALFVRNIHGSAQYDDWLERKGGYTPSFEKNLFGRYSVFGLAIAALFLGPHLVSHEFVNHTPGVTQGIIILFLSPGVYLIWDILLFFSEPDDVVSGELRMHDVTLHWFKIDMLALLGSFGFLLSYWVLAKKLPELVVGVDFIAVATFVITVDYFWNHGFYFPLSSSESSAAAAA